MVGYELYPFSFSELNDISFNLVEILFQQNFYDYFENIKNKNYDEILNRLLIGGFPEIQTIDISMQKQWFSNYFRDNKTYEVDFIIENNKGQIICVEVKSAQNITENDLKGLRSFKRNFEKNITAMYVFYGGEEISAKNIDNFPVYLLPYKYLF